MESRNTMILGGAAVAVITFAVASAVSLTNAAALHNSPGRALAASSITLPRSGESASPASMPDAAKTTPEAALPSSARPSTAVIVPAPAPVTVTPTGRTSVTRGAAESTSRKATSTKAKASSHTDTAGAAKTHRSHTTKAKSHSVQRDPGRNGKGPNRVQAHRSIKTPALRAGRVSGETESPSSSHGSKKGQSPHSPDARD